MSTIKMKVPHMSSGLIRFLMLPVMVSLISISVYFTYLWHRFLNFEPVVSWCLSGSFILLANILFSLGMGRKFASKQVLVSWQKYTGTRKEYRNYKNKEKFRFTGLEKAALVVWALITVYSMSTTMAAQFNRHLEKQNEEGITATQDDRNRLKKIDTEIQNEENPVIVKNDSLVTDYTNQIKLLQDEMGQINTDLKNLGAMPSEKNALWYWYDTKKRYDKRLEEIRESIEKNQNKKDALLLPPEINYKKIDDLKAERSELTAKGADKENIFTFLSGIFSVTPDTMQFILSLLPSILIDLLAPIASTVFFYGTGSLGSDTEQNINTLTENELQSAYKEGADKAFGMMKDRMWKK